MVIMREPLKTITNLIVVKYNLPKKEKKKKCGFLGFNDKTDNELIL